MPWKRGWSHGNRQAVEEPLDAALQPGWLHGYLNDVPPSEFEAAYAAQQTDQQLVGIQ